MTAADWLHFLALHLSWSLLAVGGAMTLAPGLHRELVIDRQWLSEVQFQDCVTLAQATPGPNVLYIALAGWTVGLNAASTAPAAVKVFLPGLGLLLALGGVLLPSSVLTVVITRWLHHHRERLAVRAFRQAMAPVVVGVMMATAVVLGSAVVRGGPCTGARCTLCGRPESHRGQRDHRRTDAGESALVDRGRGRHRSVACGGVPGLTRTRKTPDSPRVTPTCRQRMNVAAIPTLAAAAPAGA